MRRAHRPDRRARAGPGTPRAVLACRIAALLCAGHDIPATVIELLPISLILIVYAAAFSLLISIAQIGFRDIAIGLPLLLQGLMFTTPVLYTLDAVPEQWRLVYSLNPLALLIEAFRGALIDKQTIGLGQLAYAAIAGTAPGSHLPRWEYIKDPGVVPHYPTRVFEDLRLLGAMNLH